MKTNNHTKETEKALKDLKEFGAEISTFKVLDVLMYQVRDNGIWGFANDEPDMILDEDELIDLHDKYIDHE